MHDRISQTGYENIRLDRTGQAEAFDAIGDRYDEAFPHKEGQLAAGQWLIDALPAGSRVLDLGCGTGLPTARQLAGAGFEVVGVDLSHGMVELARRYVPDATFHRLDIADLRPGGPRDLGRFDAVTAFFSLLMLPRAEIPLALRTVRHILVPGGLFALSMVEADVDDFSIPFLAAPSGCPATSGRTCTRSSRKPASRSPMRPRTPTPRRPRTCRRRSRSSSPAGGPTEGGALPGCRTPHPSPHPTAPDRTDSAMAHRISCEGPDRPAAGAERPAAPPGRVQSAAPTDRGRPGVSGPTPPARGARDTRGEAAYGAGAQTERLRYLDEATRRIARGMDPDETLCELCRAAAPAFADAAFIHLCEPLPTGDAKPVGPVALRPHTTGPRPRAPAAPGSRAAQPGEPAVPPDPADPRDPGQDAGPAPESTPAPGPIPRR